MVESALEFARIARKNGFHNFKFSMKSSNPKIMIQCYRLLVARLEQEGPDWNYPIHLGVTEAGEGEDGRIKSAIGIGSLLCDGLGDTIRVSLTEDSPREIEVCRDLLAQVPPLTVAADTAGSTRLRHSAFGLRTFRLWPFDPFSYTRRPTPRDRTGRRASNAAANKPCASSSRAPPGTRWPPSSMPAGRREPEAIYEDLNVCEIDPTGDFEVNCDTQLVTVKDGAPLPAVTAFRLLAAKLKRLGRNNPILLKDCLSFETPPLDPKIALLRASVVIGSLLADGIGDAILVRGESGAGQSLRLAYNILQRQAAARSRPITSLAPRAAARSSTCKPSLAASKPAPSTSKG